MRPVFFALIGLLAAAGASALDLPKSYVCRRAATPVVVDGKTEEAAWQTAPWSEFFVDIEGARKPQPRFRTRVKMLWDERAFYVAAEMEEPDAWATIVQRDAVIFRDNDFEFFLDPDGDNFDYGELEINALNTQWDLFLPKPYKDNGHPDDGWTIGGLESAVRVRGTLNDPTDVDTGWTLEVAMPWAGLERCSHSKVAPLEGEQWRVNFSRVEWRLDTTAGAYRKIEGLPEDNWVWSPQYVVNMHRPETWGIVQFSAQDSGTVQVKPDPAAEARVILHAAYYAEAEYFKTHGHYTMEVADLAMDPSLRRTPRDVPMIALTRGGFVASLEVRDADGTPLRATILQDSHFTIRPISR